MKLLSVSSDAKTVKGEKKGYLTGILYLAPANTSGVMNVCTSSSEGCRQACLNTAGRAGIFPMILEARKRKTIKLFDNPQQFRLDLAQDIEALIRSARRKEMAPCVRINGTSDLPKLALDMVQRFPDVQFYDYTKHARPWERTAPNYHLTFSLSEDNQDKAIAALNHGINLAVVFPVKRGHVLPSEWHGVPVIDGDLSDLRFLDKAPDGHSDSVVVGLRAKGKARKDDSGFVQITL